MTFFFHYVSHFIHLLSITFTITPGGNLCSQEQSSGILLPNHRTSKNPRLLFFCYSLFQMLSDRLPIVVSTQSVSSPMTDFELTYLDAFRDGKVHRFISAERHPDQFAFQLIYFIASFLVPLFLTSRTHSHLLWIWALQQVSKQEGTLLNIQPLYG